jgi:hypothetical protein
MRRRAAWAALAGLSLACATRSPGQQGQPPVPADSAALPPAGLGTLHQDDIAIRLSTPTVQVRVLPLDEQIIRLLAPDSYGSLRALLAARARDLDSAARAAALPRPGTYLVTFFGIEARAAFTPDDITISSQNRFFRPAAIVPLSPQWSAGQLAQRETASALYLFEDGIALLQPLTLAYAGVSDSGWEGTLRLLERERSRVDARSGTRPPR